MNDNYELALEFMEKPYKVIRANNGGIRFSVTSFGGRRQFILHLLTKKCSHEQAYAITLSDDSLMFDVERNERVFFKIPNFYNQNTHHFYLTWFSDIVRMGKVDEPPLFKYEKVKTTSTRDTSGNNEMIGFVRFETSHRNGRAVEWKVDSMPTICRPMTGPKQINGGELRWVRMTSGSTLPIDALIGGLEGEPIYIARAMHRGSLCPGKYIKSKQLAYLPWSHEEIPKNEFEILCGYDAIWVNCNGSNVPENAFIGGYSEINNEPLFIGRGWVHNNLIVGKVLMLYKTCYLPYLHREWERTRFEMLVMANKKSRGVAKHTVCYMSMAMQPCV